jgi:GT2 family glycosyltransferase
MSAQMSAEKKPRVCVAIISYNSSATLPRCLDSLAAQTYRDFCIILIDNASKEKPGKFLADLSIPATYMEMEENLGFAEGMNVALTASECEYLAALNPDAFPDPNWLAELVSAADRHPTIAALGSLQLDASDRTRIDGFGDNLLIWGPAWRGQSHPPRDSGDGISRCFGVCAAAALYRAEALHHIGGFDNRFFCFYEDADVSFRLRLAGHDCAVTRTAIVEHVGGASFEGKSDFAQFLMARNQWWVLIKNMPALLLINALPGFFLVQIYGLIKHPNSPRMKGLWQGLSRTREFLKSRQDIQGSRMISAFALSRWLTWNPRAFFRKATITKSI